MRKLNLVFGVCLILASSLGVRAAAPKLITEAPEGRSVNYVKTSQGRLPNVVDYQGDSGAAEFVFTDNGEVYIKGILSCDVVFGNNFESGYAKGIFEDGVIVLNTNQCISYSSERFRGYSLVVIKRDGDSWVIDKESKQIRFTVADDGTVTLDENTPVGLVNVYSDGVGSFANIMEWSQTYKVFDHDIVSKPEALSTEKWGITSADGTARFVEVGIDGNHMYIGGVSEYMPDAWIKGAIDGTQVTFDSKQYIGICNGLYQFFMTSEIDEENDKMRYSLSDSPAVFNYDATLRTLTTVGNKAVMVNSSLAKVNHLTVLEKPFMYYFDGYKAGTPVNPTGLHTDGFDISSMRGSFEFYLSLIDTEGRVLNSDYYFYNIYVDGELFTFTSEEYSDITSDLTDIPYFFNDDWDFMTGGRRHRVSYYVDGIETLGVQAIYAMDDMPQKSAIVNLNVETGEISVIEGPVSGVDRVNPSLEIEGVTYYDVSGRKVLSPVSNGIVIKHTTYSDGSVKNEKIIVK